MKRILIALLMLIPFIADAQTGLLLKRYYITGSLSVGKDGRGFADSSAWLQIGTDTTDRGVILPKVILDSIQTTARALYVYDLKDSVLYHFDGSKKVRYMTYKDTALVKQIVLANAPNLAPYVQKTDSATWLPTKTFLLNNYFIKGGNSFGEVTALGTKDSQPLDLLTANTIRLRLFSNGNVSIGATTDENYKLSVTGTARITNEAYIEKALTFKNNTQGIQILDGGTGYSSIMIGKNNGTYPSNIGRHVKIGNDNSSNSTKSFHYAIGSSNNLGAAGSFAIAIGTFNAILTEEPSQTIIGDANTLNYSFSSTSRGQCIIGTNNSLLHPYSSVIGNYQQTTGNNQLIFADGNPNASGGGYRQVYFGSGPKSSLNGGIGAPVTINASGGNGTDKAGGLLRLAAGKSTGAAVAPDIIFATTTTIASGSDLQTLTDRWYVKGETGRLSNNSNPTALLDVQAVNGYNQLRLRSSYTPGSTADANGQVGDVAWDADYIYLKTAAGWKRCALANF